MTNIVLSPEARHDLGEVGDFIAFKLRNKAAARRMLVRIQKAVLPLEQFPESGMPLAFSGPGIAYRYLLCGSYMIFYHISDSAVNIDRVLYCRRDYLAILFGGEFTEENR